ncbi:MAG: acyl carrier protein [Rhizomicrobium sp.]|jgi:acyl carrier protein
MDENLHAVETFIRDLFDEYSGPVTRQLTAKDVRQWDSLGHVQLMVAIEQAFGIRFNSNEVRKFANVGELVDAIAGKKAAKG